MFNFPHQQTSFLWFLFFIKHLPQNDPVEFDTSAQYGDIDHSLLPLFGSYSFGGKMAECLPKFMCKYRMKPYIPQLHGMTYLSSIQIGDETAQIIAAETEAVSFKRLCQV